ncbi:transglutaminase domain-containing protein [candidate division CSSED10-310 bacterium]|uniref:Transglutaminase domain-containing protein n=1 Tax=candidate division CSSED10-310 bacterium TaxID=2855610 RepID=A0ABV6YVR0_UNCC1
MNKKRSIIGLAILFFTVTSWAFPGKVVQTFKSPSTCPTGLTFDGRYVWLADHKTDTLVKIDPQNENVVHHIPSPGFWPTGLTWDGENLWNIDYRQKMIFQVDPHDGTILRTLYSPAEHPQGLAWDGHTLWVSDSRDRKIRKLDLSDGTAVQTITAPARCTHGLTFDGTYLWCSDRIADELYMIDPQQGEVVMVLKSPGPYPRGLAWDGKNLWNVDYQKDEIHKLIQRDEELYRLEQKRHTLVTLTHEVNIFGTGQLKEMNVFVALPDNLPHQTIVKTEFSPAKYRTVTDKWQQTFAAFVYHDVKAEATVRTTMTVEARLYNITYYIFPDRCGTLNDIPSDLIQTYTANGSKYMIDDEFIQQSVKNIVGSEKNPYWIARKIFDYVRQTLEYKLEGGWNRAPYVLKRGTGSCSEYTFSFIALCRAAGLPARYVGGVVVRYDDASLDEYFHRWPEVYLPQYGWIPIDPQAGDTEKPRERALSIGHLPNKILITTQGGGDSAHIGWSYNTRADYITDPQIQVEVDTFAEWEPIEVEKIMGK